MKRSPVARDGGLAALIRLIARMEISGARVSIPARVVAYDPAAQTVDADPDILKPGGQPLPRVFACPVQMPTGAGLGVALPLAAGDPVLLVFSDRSLEEWLTSGKRGAPSDPRTHHLTDAIAIPGVRPIPEAWGGLTADKLVIGQLQRDGTPAAPCQIRISNAGKLAIGTPTAELVTMLGDLVSALQSAMVATLAGPQPLDPATQATLTSLAAAIAGLKE